MNRIVTPKTLLIASALIITGYFAFNYFFSKEFDKTTFTGSSEKGTIIALDLKSKGGKITGKGFHFFPKSKQIHEVSVKGKIDIWGNLELKETENGTLFGKVEGKLSRNLENIDCEWANNRDSDLTELTLEKSDDSAEDWLEPIKLKLEEERKAQEANKNEETENKKTSDTAGEKVGGIVDWALSKTGDIYRSMKSSLEGKKK